MHRLTMSSRPIFLSAFSKALPKSLNHIISKELKMRMNTRKMHSSFHSLFLPVTLFCDWAIHNLSITMACWVVLSGYSLSIRFKSESGISRHWANGIQSRPSRLQISDKRKSAYSIENGNIKRGELLCWFSFNPIQCLLIFCLVFFFLLCEWLRAGWWRRRVPHHEGSRIFSAAPASPALNGLFRASLCWAIQCSSCRSASAVAHLFRPVIHRKGHRFKNKK